MEQKSVQCTLGLLNICKILTKYYHGYFKLHSLMYVRIYTHMCVGVLYECFSVLLQIIRYFSSAFYISA